MITILPPLAGEVPPLGGVGGNDINLYLYKAPIPLAIARGLPP